MVKVWLFLWCQWSDLVEYERILGLWWSDCGVICDKGMEWSGSGVYYTDVYYMLFRIIYHEFFPSRGATIF